MLDGVPAVPRDRLATENGQVPRDSTEEPPSPGQHAVPDMLRAESETWSFYSDISGVQRRTRSEVRTARRTGRLAAARTAVLGRSMPVTSTAWLSSLLGPVGLSVPDGRPLYSYRCSTERFEEARDVLTGWRPQRDPGAGGRVFAVYAAEWWQRNYDGGPWAWQPLLDSIRCEAAFPELYEPLRNAWRW